MEMNDLPNLSPLRKIFVIALVLPVIFTIFYITGIFPVLDLFEGGARFTIIGIFVAAAVLSLTFGFYVSTHMQKKLRGQSTAEIIPGLAPIYVIRATAFSSISTWGVILGIFGIDKPIVLTFFAIPIILLIWYFPTRIKMQKMITRLTESKL